MPYHPTEAGIARRKAIREFVIAYTKEHGFAPSMQEIGDAIQGSKSSVLFHVRKLVSEGALVHMPGKARAIAVGSADGNPGNRHRCDHCGKLVSNDYDFCPWCGTRQ